MDPMDVLGELLGGAARGGNAGAGGRILKDILGGGSSGRASTNRAPAQPRSGQARQSAPTDIDREARELEDLLNVARNRAQTREHGSSSSKAPVSPAPTSPVAHNRDPFQTAPTSSSSINPTQTSPFGRQPAPHSSSPFSPAPVPTPKASLPQGERQNQQAVVLIRAMLNAAKADGEISQDEQQRILEQLANPTPEALAFLRQEVAQPLNVRDFAWSVPLGMEQQVYMFSLAAITLDSKAEADYLRELAHGLRLSPDVCNEIHGQLGAPSIFAGI